MSNIADSAADDILESAFESAMDGMAILDGDGTYVYVNRAHAELYGYDEPATLLGQSWRTLYDDEEVRRFEREVFPVLEADGQWRGRAVGRTRDGETFRQELSLSRSGADGLVCVVRDVSEQAERRRALERQENILESVRDPIYTLDPMGTITWVNRFAVEAFDAGYTREDLIGEHVSKIMSDADIEQCLELIEELLEEDGPESQRCEVDLISAYGDEIPCELNITLQPFEDGEFQGTVGVVRDIRDRKRREQQLSVLNRVLRHNLRNRMTVLLGHLATVEEHVSEGGTENLRVVREAAEGVVELSNSASRIAHMIEEDDGLHPSVDVVDVIETSAAAFEDQYPEATITVDTPDSQSARANAQLAAVVDALVENAIEHADGTPKVSLRVDPPGEEGELVSISVMDDGPGIPSSEIEVLNDDREQPLSHGSGLGLWYVRWYVDSHGGEIDFDRTPEGETIVRLRLRPV